jgi:hypothetical protein
MTAEFHSITGNRPVEVEASAPSSSSDPESEFLDTVSHAVYPQIKARRADISLAEVRATADIFKGARIRGFVPVLLTRVILEPSFAENLTPPQQPQETTLDHRG